MFASVVRNIGSVFQGFVSASLNWDEFLDVLNKPERLGEFVEAHERTIGLHLLFLAQALKVNPSENSISPHASENFDRATFGIGQVMSFAPARLSRLPCALTLVDSLGVSLQHGWTVHHGVAKFAANSLVQLATCVEADTGVRKAALDRLFSSLWEWLQDNQECADGTEICGCSCSRPSTSATCWVERLLAQPDPLISEWLMGKQDLLQAHAPDVQGISFITWGRPRQLRRR